MTDDGNWSWDDDVLNVVVVELDCWNCAAVGAAATIG